MPKKLAVITGDKRLNKALTRLTGTEQKKALRQETRPAIKPIMQESRSNTKQHKRTGQMGRKIKVRSIPRSRSRIGSRVTTRQQDFSGSFYTTFVQLGWKAGKSNRQIEGTNDMQRAADSKQKQVIRDYHRRALKRVYQMAKK